MFTRSKLLFAAFAAGAMLFTLVASASARNWRITEKNFEMIAERAAPLTFEAAGNTISCPITLLGSWVETTVTKATGLMIGNLRHTEPPQQGAPPCTGGSLTILTETLPWRINYSGFTGTLPRITDIRLSIIGIAFRISTSGLGCLAGTTSLKPAFGELVLGSTGVIEGFRFDERVGIPLGGGFVCEIAGESHFSGTQIVRNLPRIQNVTMALI